MPALRFGLVALTPSMSASTYCTVKYTKLAKGTLISTTTRYSPLHPRSPYRMSAPVSCYGNVRLETDNSIDNTGNSTGSDTDNTDIVSTGGTGNSTRPRFRHDISILLGRERRKAERNRAFSASSSATRSQK